jgi:hypothetical protein
LELTTHLQKKWLIHNACKGCGLPVGDDMNVARTKKIVQAQMSKPIYEISHLDLDAILELILEYEAESKHEN